MFCLNFQQLFTPGSKVLFQFSRAFQNLVRKQGHGPAQIADNGNIRVNDLVDFHIVHFELDNGSIFGKLGNIAGDTVTEAGADGQDQVALCYGHIGSIGPMHTHHTKMRVIKIRNRAFAHERCYNRHTGGFHDLADKLRRIGRNNAAAGHQDRFLRFFKSGNRSVNSTLVSGEIRFITAEMHFFRICEIDFRPEHVGRNINQNRAGTSGGGDQKRFFNNPGQILDLFYQIIVFGNRSCNTGDIRFLERVPADGFGGYLRAENH